MGNKMRVTEYPLGYLIRAEAKRETTMRSILMRFCLLLIIIWLALRMIPETNRGEIINPCPESGCIPVVTPTPTPENTPKPTPEAQKTGFVSGLASYYSREGCLGCSATLTMANGQPLDDSALTVAYNRAPLNSYVKITNQKTGHTVTAKVSDRGGFERHGKIIDLTIATRDALGCGDVCSVEISSN